MNSQNSIFKIFGAYQWQEENNDHKMARNEYSVIAIKELLSHVQKRVDRMIKDSEVKLSYGRLRATAGSFVLDGIKERIKNSNAIIFDITGFSSNVMFELGIAMEASRTAGKAKVYIICQGEGIKTVKVPSDLNGYFISFYEIKNKKVTFHDNNSLAMRLVSEMIGLSNQGYVELDNE
jgi:hypothetical protein